jgi:hypothetical protein
VNGEWGHDDGRGSEDVAQPDNPAAYHRLGKAAILSWSALKSLVILGSEKSLGREW